MRRTVAAILLLAVLVLGAGWIASAAYQAGLSAGLAGAGAGSAGAAAGATVVVPAYGPGWWSGFGGPAFGFGFGPFGFLGAILVLVLIVGLLRVAFGYGHRHGFAGPSGFGGWPHETFEDLHRRAHQAGTSPDDREAPGASGTSGGPGGATRSSGGDAAEGGRSAG